MQRTGHNTTKASTRQIAKKLNSPVGKPPIVKAVKTRLGLFKSALSRGDTKLHLLARSACTIKEFNVYMDYIGEQKAIRLAKTPNDIGRLPIDDLPTKRHKTVASTLLEQTVADTLLPVSRQVNQAQVLRQYQQIGDEQLQQNLKLACRAANKVRRLKLQSETHPCANLLPINEKKALSRSIQDLRAKTDLYPALTSGARRFAAQKQLEELHVNNRRFALAKVGNCCEYAKLALEYVREIDHQVRAEAVSIVNGDHVFVVIGRRPRSDIRDFTDWGSQAVVCDAWAGAVYPASAIPERLADFKYLALDKKYYSVVTGFNPNYHRLASDYELPAFKV